MYDVVRSLDVSRLRYIIICYGTLNVKFLFFFFFFIFNSLENVRISNDYCGVGSRHLMYNEAEKKKKAHHYGTYN